MPSHRKVRFDAEIHRGCPIGYRVCYFGTVHLQEHLSEMRDRALPVLSRYLNSTVQPADIELRDAHMLPYRGVT